jgi:hypothetical protein
MKALLVSGAAALAFACTQDDLPPRVIATDPGDLATDVGVDTTIAVTFSEAMDTALTEAGFVTTPWLQGAFAWSHDDSEMVFTPVAELGHATEFAVIVSTGATDVSGNHLEATYQFQFTTTTAPDLTAPTVLATAPAGGASGVAVDTALSVQFSEPMDAAASQAAFTFNPSVTGTFSWSEDGSATTFTPDADLAYEATYAVEIGSGATDVAGNPLSSAYTFDFTTEDVTPPQVTDTLPLDGALDVGVSEVVSVTFSEPMDTLRTENAFVMYPWVTGTFDWSASDTELTLTPSQPLATDTTYTVTVGTGATDVAGNPLDLAHQFTFATPDTTPPVFTLPPVIAMNPNGSTPLAGLLSLATDEPADLVIEFDDGEGHSWTVTFDALLSGRAVPLLGFHPDRTYTVDITVTDEAGNDTSWLGLPVTTDPLPDDFPPLELKVSNPAMMEPGVTMFETRRRLDGGTPDPDSLQWIVMVDEEGEVVWYYDHDAPIGDHRRLSNGNLAYITARRTIAEIDMLGEVVRMWQTSSTPVPRLVPGSILVDTDTFHHEFFEMPSGNILVLSSEVATYEDFPTSTTDPDAPTATSSVVGDVVVEFAPDGTVIETWSLLDLLDPIRVGHGSLQRMWNRFYPEAAPTNDWSHGNAVVYDPLDDSILVSLRHQDAIIKFSRATGELLWILGPHANWVSPWDDLLLDPLGDDFEWPYHPHAPMVTGDGTILLYDNGNFRASAFEPMLDAVDNYSRAVEYLVDGNAMEVSQVWEYGSAADEILYTPFIGDADWLPKTGNAFITFGGIAHLEGVPTDAANTSTKLSARLIEVTRTAEPEVVWDLSIADDDESSTVGWRVYRSERLPSLYP